MSVTTQLSLAPKQVSQQRDLLPSVILFSVALVTSNGTKAKVYSPIMSSTNISQFGLHLPQAYNKITFTIMPNIRLLIDHQACNV